MTDAPVVDPRGEEEVLADLEARLPGHLPGWTPAVGSSARAVQRIAAGFAATLGRGLNQALPRGQLAFLDTCGEARLPAQPASVPLVFNLDDQSADAPMPAGTSVAAQANTTAGGDPPAFVVTQSIALVRAKLAACYSIDGPAGRWDDHTAALGDGFTLFEGSSVVEHAIYLGHDHLFKLPLSARIMLFLELVDSPGSARREELRLAWEYRAADAWRPLEGSIADMLITDGSVDLRKDGGAPASEEVVLGQKSFWLRGSVVDPLVGGGAERLPVVAGVRASLDFGLSDLRPDAVLVDSSAIDFTAPFDPFGRTPARGTTFYLGCSEAFGRPGARVRMDFQFADPAHLVRAKGPVTWEYFDGDVWKPLDGVVDTTNVLLDTSAQTDDALVPPHDGPVAFVAPPDWQPTTVGNKTSHFLRVRLDAPDVYGTPPGFVTTADQPPTFVPGTLQPPLIAKVRLTFSQLTEPTPVDHCVTANASILEDHTAAARFSQGSFVPFVPGPDEHRAVYLAFDRPLPAGLVSLYVDVATPAAGEPAQEDSPFIWEYAASDGWKSLSVRDDTAGFHRSGVIQLIGPFDAVATDGPGGPLYRIRARLKQGAPVTPRAVSGMWMNAVIATNAEFYGGEILGNADGVPRQSLSFPPGRTPVHSGEIVEVREWAGRDRGYETVADEVPPADRRPVRDPATGEVIELWVRWQPLPHLFGAGASARVYTLERATGLLRFGDGIHGFVPPAGAPVQVAFTTGGGLVGNVPAGSITELRAALPFVVRVTNPRPARGGSDTEAPEVTRRRGAERLRHRDKALAPRDFEWLSLQASPAVARAHCLPTTGPDGRGQRGWVTVAVIPYGLERQPQPDSELLARVRDYLAARAPAAIAGQVRVVGPTYQAISVVAEVIPLRPDEASTINRLLRARLDTFLHPLRGGPAGEGWSVGQSVPLSQVAALIQSTPGVDFAREVVLQVEGATYGDEVPVDPDALPSSGNHEIRLSIGADAEAC